jgi:hypothetical protein
MTKEDKELLFKDLCARLPYGVKVQVYYEDIAGSGYFDETVWLIDNDEPFHVNDRWIENIKPYLRPMSSMTEEEKKELQKITNNKFYAHYNYISNSKPSTDGEWHTPYNNFVTSVECNKTISWLDEKHFDHRTDEEGKTLIEKGLALEAPEGMYNIK